MHENASWFLLNLSFQAGCEFVVTTCTGKFESQPKDLRLVKHSRIEGGDPLRSGVGVASRECAFGEFKRGRFGGIERMFAVDCPTCLIRQIVRDVWADDLFEVDAFVAVLATPPDIEGNDNQQTEENKGGL